MMSWCRQCFSDVEVLDGGKRMSCRACGAEHEWRGTHWCRTKEGAPRAAAALHDPVSSRRPAPAAEPRGARTATARVCCSFGDAIAPSGRFTTVRVRNLTDHDTGPLLVALGKALRALQPGEREELLSRWEKSGGLELQLESVLATHEGRAAFALAEPYSQQIWVTPFVAFGSDRSVEILTHELHHLLGHGYLPGQEEPNEDVVQAMAEATIATGYQERRI